MTPYRLHQLKPDESGGEATRPIPQRSSEILRSTPSPNRRPNQSTLHKRLILPRLLVSVLKLPAPKTSIPGEILSVKERSLTYPLQPNPER